MAARAFLFGHPIYAKDGRDWKYEDTDEPINTAAPRKCPSCGLYKTKDGHDPCIANLPGVEFACCGHGIARGYVKFENGQVLRGDFDIKS